MRAQIDPASPAGIAGRRVLVAEDEALIALDIELTLTGKGCEVVGPAGRLDQAIRVAESETIELAVLDVMLGRDDVHPLAELLAERGVPFVFHSGHGDPVKLRERFPKAGFVRKPCSPVRLIEALKAVAEG